MLKGMEPWIEITFTEGYFALDKHSKFVEFFGIMTEKEFFFYLEI